ncbi:MAG: histidine kinase, partial [Bacteroidota bacterium]
MVRTIIIRILIFTVGGFLTSLIFCPPCYAISFGYAFDTFRYYVIIFAILWEINRLLIRLIDQKFDWITETRFKVFVNLVLLLLTSIPAILTVIYIAFEVIGPRPLNTTTFDWTTYYSLAAYHFFTGVVISLILNSQNFFQSWKAAILREESLKQKQIEYQLQALVNQVNPHFLFNNLHTLNSVLRQNTTLAEQFIYQLSKVYRYLLSGNRSRAVYLHEEQTFLNAYFFLLNIRFGDCIKINFKNIPTTFKIAPITL